ncbi:hypothetical protein IFJ82_02905 [Novacetimonas hansenii]|uniref:Uncharacterized protein n=1 Tax=Novacetimonas hansenii TaxID=436 RepID=A0AAW5EU71_NOVHA|nr:hypothetical protein [Novacetimonas hansenii]MBL7235952.1 hypothetical protein [Novacetimonas hansenii]MCJ8354860.1 hypothetical protein [Novacetimonas hansenii]PYD73342.1 hypothetical protein CFR74_04240 [Novacetimonas hansenii]QOF95636.1 hypothetical protein IFJ82_02905 [Novacetimonas hansenii]RFP02624.1 hypothetical protein BGC30_04345 [Novacetimonas hansenii]
MYKAMILAAVFGAALAGVPGGPCAAQTVLDGSDAHVAGAAEAMKKVAATLKHPNDARFRHLAAHDADGAGVVCGEVAETPARGAHFAQFGYVVGHDEPIVFANRPIPAVIPFAEVNGWINDSVHLEDLEEMGCAPKGSYHTYNEKLNTKMNQRKQYGVN